MDSFPKTKYSKTAYCVVNSADEETQLGSGWYDTPAKVPGAVPDDNGYVAAPVYQEVSPMQVAKPVLPEGNTYYDRVVWQAQHLGIKIDKRWSLETLLRKVAEFQPLTQEGIEEANKAVPDDQALDYDPTLTAAERDKQEAVDAAVEAVKPSKKAK